MTDSSRLSTDWKSFGSKLVGCPRSQVRAATRRILTDTITARRRAVHTTADAESALLVGLDLPGAPWDVDTSLDELRGLAETAGLTPVGRITQRAEQPHPRYYVGKGKLAEIRDAVGHHGCEVVVFDDELSPRTLESLGKELDAKIIDRTLLILDVFAHRARSYEGRVQVELAQYQYLLPRLAGQGRTLSRLGGGIGTRGPGETKLETDRRRIRARIADLSRSIDEIRRDRAVHRQLRRRRELPLVALVGYTNVGKSTLLNALTRADAYAADVVFATLDPLTRRLRLPSGQRVLLTDTVGLIAKLPTAVVAAFRATLEELQDADLLVHVVDLTHPHAAEQNAIVHDLLRELDLSTKPIVTAVNKVDALVPPASTGPPGAAELGLPPSDEIVLVSAVREWGLPELQRCIEDALAETLPTIEVAIPYEQGRLVTLFRQRGRVTYEGHTQHGTILRGQLPYTMHRAFEPYLRGPRSVSRHTARARSRKLR
jgi:GTPase